MNINSPELTEQLLVSNASQVGTFPEVTPFAMARLLEETRNQYFRTGALVDSWLLHPKDYLEVMRFLPPFDVGPESQFCLCGLQVRRSRYVPCGKVYGLDRDGKPVAFISIVRKEP